MMAMDDQNRCSGRQVGEQSAHGLSLARNGKLEVANQGRVDVGPTLVVSWAR